MKKVTLYEHPDSALCVRCKNGEMHLQQTDDALTELTEYDAICFINSIKNDGIACSDFILDEDKQEMYSDYDDFEGYFDLPETKEEQP